MGRIFSWLEMPEDQTRGSLHAHSVQWNYDWQPHRFAEAWQQVLNGCQQSIQYVLAALRFLLSFKSSSLPLPPGRQCRCGYVVRRQADAMRVQKREMDGQLSRLTADSPRTAQTAALGSVFYFTALQHSLVESEAVLSDGPQVIPHPDRCVCQLCSCEVATTLNLDCTVCKWPEWSESVFEVVRRIAPVLGGSVSDQEIALRADLTAVLLATNIYRHSATCAKGGHKGDDTDCRVKYPRSVSKESHGSHSV
jgi:hypothetical protein